MSAPGGGRGRTVIDVILHIGLVHRQDGFGHSCLRGKGDLGIEIPSSRGGDIAWDVLCDLIIEVGRETCVPANQLM